jgi:hypothetical protein
MKYLRFGYFLSTGHFARVNGKLHSDVNPDWDSLRCRGVALTISHGLEAV